MRLSVVIPAFNAEGTLGRCVSSILNQGMDDLEIVIIDDHSIDGTWSICGQLANMHTNIVVRRNEQNIGQGLSRNIGIGLASGDFVGFVDSDDYVSSFMYADMLSLVDADCDVVKCGIQRVEIEDMELRLTDRLIGLKTYCGQEVQTKGLPPFFGGLPEESLADVQNVSACTGIYRRETIIKNRIQFESERALYSEDLFFNIDVFRVSRKCVFIETPYYFYWTTAGSTSRTFHDPVSKCERLVLLASGNDDLSVRADRTCLNALKDAAIQLSRDNSLHIWEKVSLLRRLESMPCFLSAFSRYPIQALPSREKIFLMVAKCRLGFPELFLGYLNNLRSTSLG